MVYLPPDLPQRLLDRERTRPQDWDGEPGALLLVAEEERVAFVLREHELGFCNKGFRHEEKYTVLECWHEQRMAGRYEGLFVDELYALAKEHNIAFHKRRRREAKAVARMNDEEFSSRVASKLENILS